MLSPEEYKEALDKIKAMSAEEFIRFIDCSELSQEDKQLLYDRFGRSKMKWWNKNKSITAIAVRKYKSEKTIQRETRRAIGIILSTMSPKESPPEVPYEDWSKSKI